jgi:hypothetical protein
MAISFEDLDKLPDDVEFQLPDGSKIKLGEVRSAAKDHVSKRIADLTPREQKLVSREAELGEREKAVRETVAYLATAPPQPPGASPPSGGEVIPLGYTREQWAAIKNDPYSRPLVEATAFLAEKLEKMEKTLADTTASQQQRDEHRRQSDEINWINYQFEHMAKQDPRYVDPAERKSLLDYAKEVLQKRDLTVIDRGRNYGAHVKEAEERGYKKGLSEAPKLAPVPSIPYGSRAVPTPPPAEKLPATFNEFADQAAADQSLIQEIREAASVPSPGSSP